MLLSRYAIALSMSQAMFDALAAATLTSTENETMSATASHEHDTTATAGPLQLLSTAPPSRSCVRGALKQLPSRSSATSLGSITVPPHKALSV
eukprot:CAMPEP_0198353230 /NCGR_PEP_ID=MMETSP1450-20131203/110706_1 /TAXON_ID=753684 ORGANISM="Madagascaria erythrocladiodes, Strain CCMP3234" /NCGR_SAMPLE_ID=MMETSP1450 /ASSEMBLY_ACC=CAM_ASM_001115 /LENGTH=92 /DNA_ID=CAMNT_0044059351 /DNA_START=29 /DNA_END=307 /DNA_ORIENTATION=+